MILRAESFYAPQTLTPIALWVHLGKQGERKTSSTEHAMAKVNHGRWIVECPFCPSAQIVSPEDPRFLCAECLNRDVGERFVSVLFPSRQRMENIEAVLEVRPSENQNWVPGESLALLKRENEAHGL